eukprot:scaffold2195_cov430-Prasinococcus_capsulatus_cf.AAC.1
MKRVRRSVAPPATVATPVASIALVPTGCARVARRRAQLGWMTACGPRNSSMRGPTFGAAAAAHAAGATEGDGRMSKPADLGEEGDTSPQRGRVAGGWVDGRSACAYMCDPRPDVPR